MSSSSELSSPCQGRGHGHHFLAVAPRRTHGLPGLPSPQATRPCSKDQESSQTSPRPPVPPLQPRHLTCLSSWVLSRMAARAPSPLRLSPEGLKILSLELPYPTHTLTLPSALTLQTPKPPASCQRICPRHHPQSMGSSRPQGTPRVPQVGIPFSSPPSRSSSLGPAPSGLTRGMRTGRRIFPTQEKGGGRKPQRPERKHNCEDVRARPPDRNCRIFQRKSCSQREWGCVMYM